MINCVVWLDYHILTRRLSDENYKIEIKETLCKIVEVEASSSEQAEKMVNEQWYKGEHILDSDNFKTISLEAKDLQKNKKYER